MARVTHGVYRTLYTPPPGADIRVPYSFMGSPYGAEEKDAVNRVIDSGWLTTGLETVAFEREWAEYHEVPYAYTASNATAALHMAAQLLQLEPGDEVVTTPITFVSTNQAVLARGATPVFVDVDPRTFNISPEAVVSAITPKTKALFVTHLAGQMCDMDALTPVAEEHGLSIVEDCAHAHGGTYRGRFAGSFGDIGCFSFHAIKNMTTLGEGGMLTTRHDRYATKIPWLRSMGTRYPDDPFDDGTPGPRPYDIDAVDGLIPSNLRMTEAQCAVGREQLKKLPSFLARRREIAHRYSRELGELEGVTVPYESPEVEHTFHLYTLVLDPAVVDNQTMHKSLMWDHGIHTVPGLYRPSYLFRLYRDRMTSPVSCPTAERVAETSLQLPLYPQMSDEQVGWVITAFREAYDELRQRSTA